MILSWIDTTPIDRGKVDTTPIDRVKVRFHDFFKY